jgi:hypothetical protein
MYTITIKKIYLAPFEGETGYVDVFCKEKNIILMYFDMKTKRINFYASRVPILRKLDKSFINCLF